MNNDRFKFRAWNKETKCYWQNVVLGVDGSLYQWGEGKALFPPLFDIEQCSGIHDDRMTPIYENDIVLFRDTRWTIEFIRGCWYGVDGRVCIKLDDMCEELEIVGNIHEGVHE